MNIVKLNDYKDKSAKVSRDSIIDGFEAFENLSSRRYVKGRMPNFYSSDYNAIGCTAVGGKKTIEKHFSDYMNLEHKNGESPFTEIISSGVSMALKWVNSYGSIYVMENYEKPSHESNIAALVELCVWKNYIRKSIERAVLHAGIVITYVPEDCAVSTYTNNQKITEITAEYNLTDQLRVFFEERDARHKKPIEGRILQLHMQKPR